MYLQVAKGVFQMLSVGVLPIKVWQLIAFKYQGLILYATQIRDVDDDSEYKPNPNIN